MSTGNKTADSCLTVIGFLIGIAIALALFSLLVWWLVPVATAGAVTVGFWQALAGLTVLYVVLRTVSVGLRGHKAAK